MEGTQKMASSPYGLASYPVVPGHMKMEKLLEDDISPLGLLGFHCIELLGFSFSLVLSF